jgi:transcriptional regulator with XRE-family HTH domain
MVFMRSYEEEMKGIGKSVAEVRRKSRMTQRDLAERTGTTINFISHFENGHRGVSFRTLNKIAGALEFPAAYLVVLNTPDVDGHFRDTITKLRDGAREYFEKHYRNDANC